jgi:hypothetical protein
MRDEIVPNSTVPPELVREVDRLLDDLSRTVWPNTPERAARRSAAASSLRDLGLDGAHAIQAIYKADTAHALNVTRSLRRSLPLAAAGWFAALLLPYYVPQIALPVVFLVAAGTLVGGLAFSLRYGFALRGPKHRVRILHAIWHVIALSDKRTIPILMDIGPAVGNLPIGGEIGRALIALLRTVDEEDEHLFTGEFRAQINAHISPWSAAGDGFRISAIHALRSVGDAESLAILERVAREDFPSHVRAAARQCLPALRHRLTLQGETLLRAAAAPARADGLLRAAGGPAASRSEGLLRAAVEEGRG